VDVVHFLLKSRRVSADFVDAEQRTLVFHAVLDKRCNILRLLLTHVGIAFLGANLLFVRLLVFLCIFSRLLCFVVGTRDIGTMALDLQSLGCGHWRNFRL